MMCNCCSEKTYIKYEREILSEDYWKPFEEPVKPKCSECSDENHNDNYLNITEIIDCDVLLRFVIVEKVKHYNHDYLRKYHKGQLIERNLKKVLKEEDGKFRSVYFDLNKNCHLLDRDGVEFKDLERSLDLYKSNAFFDKGDIDQVIKYYLNK